MEDNTKEIKEKINELAKDATFILASPETVNKLKAKGVPFQSRFIPYEEYLEKLFTEKKKVALEIIKKFPPLSENLANAAVKSLYEEIRECYAFGLFGAVITMSVILLELSFKCRIYNEKKKVASKLSWEEIERMNFIKTVKILGKLEAITDSEKTDLNKFNLEVRNSYIHYNLKKLVNGMFVERMPVIDTKTGEVKILENVDLAEKPYLWFSGKRFRDRREVDWILNFCVEWTNKIL